MVLNMSTFDGRVAPCMSKQHGLITAAQVLEHGGTQSTIRHRLRTGEWALVRFRVYRLTGAPQTDRQALLAAILAAGPDAVAWGRTAATLHGLPGFNLTPLSIAIPDPRRIRDPRIRVRRTSKMPPSHVTTIDRIPTTSVARTLFDLAATEHPKRTARALDNALSAHRVTLEKCRDVLKILAQSGRDGVVIFRNLLDDRSDGLAVAESELEVMFEELLEEAGIPILERQAQTGTSERPIGRLDYRLKNRRIVEVDGRRFHSQMVDRARDRWIDNLFISEGMLPPLRITYFDMRDERLETIRLLQRAAMQAADPSQPAQPGRVNLTASESGLPLP